MTAKTRSGPKMPRPLRRTETRHHPRGKTCHHYEFHELTCDDYDHLRARADGRCELCGTPEADTGGKRLVVDHFAAGEYETAGRPGVSFIRGMVCDRCNSMLSAFDGTKRWGPRSKAWQSRAEAYEARSWQQPTAEDRETVAQVRARRYAYLYNAKPVTPLPKENPPPKPVRVPMHDGQAAAGVLADRMPPEQLEILVASLRSHLKSKTSGLTEAA